MAVHLPGALPKLEVLDLQENGRITDAQALVSALAGGALPCLAVLRFVGTAHLKALTRTRTLTHTRTRTRTRTRIRTRTRTRTLILTRTRTLR